MNSPGGYVRLHRKVMQNPIWTQLAPAVLKVAVYFLLRASYKQVQWYDGAQTIDIPAGSFITSYRAAAADCGLSVQQTRDAFRHLSRTHFATYRRTYRWTLASVRNYERYQATSDEENTQENIHKNTRENTQENSQGTLIKEIKNKEILPTASREEFCSTENPPFNTLDEPVNGNGHDSRTRGEKLIAEYAARIHGRHPEIRRCSVNEVKSQLGKILKRYPVGEHEALLVRIDQNHASLCRSPQWTKDGGEYAKGLENWLAPTKGRWQAGYETADTQDERRRMVI